jgi:hypothetical protein
MSATPRRYRKHGDDLEVVGMDDQESFGPEVFRLQLSEAVDAGIVADYRVVVAAVDRVTFDRVAAHQAPSDIDPQLLAGAIAVVRAMGEFDLRSLISFHSRVERARVFAGLIGIVAEALPPNDRPPGLGWSAWVHGGTVPRHCAGVSPVRWAAPNGLGPPGRLEGTGRPFGSSATAVAALGPCGFRVPWVAAHTGRWLPAWAARRSR